MRGYDKRIANGLRDRVMNASSAAALIQDNMILGMSGFTFSGDPKVVPEYINAGNLTLITGSSVGEETEGVLCRKGLIGRRYPYQTNTDVRRGINDGEISYADLHLSNVASLIERQEKEYLDFAIIECTRVTEEGIVPTTSVGITPTLVKCAKNLILEVNLSIPEEVEQMLDIFDVGVAPNAKIIPIQKPMDKIGKTFIPYEKEKIKAIVITEAKGSFPEFVESDEVSKKIANHIVCFLKKEIAEGRQPENLLPLQSGVGAVANAVLGGLKEMNIRGAYMYTETMQDSAFELLKNGNLEGISTCSLNLSEAAENELFEHLDEYKNKIILRPQNVTNSPEVIRRLGVIAMNTPVELDIYGNINSTHAMGTKMINGLGGSGDFTRNCGLSIFATRSTAKDGTISRVVPMVSHCDHTEHDTQILVTEWGLADLRWKSPKERVTEIIDQCAHPDYRQQLYAYYENAVKLSGSSQTPQDLEHAFSFYVNYNKNGSMRSV